MQSQLKEIYTFLSSRQLPENIKNNLTIFLDDEKNCVDNIGSKCNKNAIEKLDEIKKRKILELIIDNEKLWEKILLFKSVELKEVKDLLIKNKIIVKNDLLKEFVTGLGVVISGGWNK